MGVADGVVNQCDEATAAIGVGPIATDGRVVREGFEIGGRAEFGFLDASNQD